MAQSLADTLYRIEDLKQQLAVWNNLTNHLAQFLDTEAREAQDGITAPGCVRPECRVRGREVVPQSVIDIIIQGIDEDHVQPLTKEIASLESLVVVEASNENPPTVTRAPLVQKAQPQKNTKRVRIVAPANRA